MRQLVISSLGVVGVHHWSQFEVGVLPGDDGSANGGISADYPFARVRAARGGGATATTAGCAPCREVVQLRNVS